MAKHGYTYHSDLGPLFIIFLDDRNNTVQNVIGAPSTSLTPLPRINWGTGKRAHNKSFHPRKVTLAQTANPSKRVELPVLSTAQFGTLTKGTTHTLNGVNYIVVSRTAEH